MESKLRRDIEKASIKVAALLLAAVIVTLPMYCHLSHEINELERRVEELEQVRVETADAEPDPEPDADTAPDIDTEAVYDVELTPIEPAAKSTKADIEPTPTNLGRFELTAYCGENYPHICNDGDATNTATGTTPTAGRTIAVDPDVIPLGSVVIINGHEYVAEDTGGIIDGNRVDIFFNSHAEALEFGVQYADVSIY